MEKIKIHKSQIRCNSAIQPDINKRVDYETFKARIESESGLQLFDTSSNGIRFMRA